MIGGVPLYATPRPLGRPTSYEQLNTDLAGAYAPDGSTLAVGLSDGAIRLQDAGTRQVRATFQGHEGTVRWIAFTQDGRSLISAGDDGIIKVWDGRTRQERNRLDGFTPRWTDLQVSPNGQMIAAINERRQAICWRITDKRSTILKKDVSVYCLAICPDSKSLVLAYWDSSESHLEVMDAGTGQVLKTLIGHQGTVTSLGFLEQGRTLVSAGKDGTIKLWQTHPSKGNVRREAP